MIENFLKIFPENLMISFFRIWPLHQKSKMRQNEVSPVDPSSSASSFENSRELAAKLGPYFDPFRQQTASSSSPKSMSKDFPKEKSSGRNISRHSEFVCGWSAAMIDIIFTYPLNKIIFRQQLHGIRTRPALAMLKYFLLFFSNHF